MRKCFTLFLASFLVVAARAEAQGAKVYCIPGTQACFSASLGFVPTPADPFYKNRLSSVITNLQGTYGGLNTPFGFLGLEYVQRWNGISESRTTTGLFELPFADGRVRENRFAPGFHFDQPTGSNGFMLMLGTGYLGCERERRDEFWTWQTCPRQQRDGSVRFNMDLAFVSAEGIRTAATFKQFALRAHTTMGSCTLSPSLWLIERTNDACEERFLTNEMIASASVTPEPGTLLLLGSGVAGIGLHFSRRFRRRR
jgi:hypothetical protein